MLIVAASSLFVWKAQQKIKKDELIKAFHSIRWGIAFGVIFLGIQLIGWQQLTDSAQSYRNILLPFALVHALHVIIGLLLMTKIFIGLKAYKIHSKAIGLVTNTARFWHFLGVVWMIAMISFL